MVYVDCLFTATPRNPGARRYGTRWCHLIADTREELHIFATTLGLKLEWFQDSPHAWHYDLTPSKRREAIKLGAIEITRRQLGEILCQRKRELSLPYETHCPPV